MVNTQLVDPSGSCPPLTVRQDGDMIRILAPDSNGDLWPALTFTPGSDGRWSVRTQPVAETCPMERDLPEGHVHVEPG